MHPQKESKGAIAQLVEQRTENPCVPGSIPGGTTPPFIWAVLARGRLFFVLPLAKEMKNEERKVKNPILIVFHFLRTHNNICHQPESQ